MSLVVMQSLDGKEILVPRDVEPDDPFARLDTDGARRYYAEQGFLVVRGLVPESLCTAIVRELHSVKAVVEPLRARRRLAGVA